MSATLNPPGPLSVRGCIAEIDTVALAHNLEVARRHARGGEVLCIVKADAYGHGARVVSSALLAHGVRRFGVATVEEGLELREAGISGQIFVLGGATWLSAPELLFAAELIPTLSSVEELVFLADAARRAGRTIDALLKLDTGMSRVGVFIGDAPKERLAPLLDVARARSEVRIAFACTHFANADLADDALTERQIERFDRALGLLVEAGLPLEAVHLSNSAATLLGLAGDEGAPRIDARGLSIWVRPGLMLYGVSPFPDGRFQQVLRPVLSWRAPIVARKRVPAGTPVSYGSTFVTEREAELAVLGVGYADGYPRALSNRASVLIAQERCPIRGRVCMDLTVVEVTDVVEKHGPEACSLGQQAILLGEDGGARIDASELAELSGTIPYEILTRIAARVPRVPRGKGATG